jgi:hypothetical protein
LVHNGFKVLRFHFRPPIYTNLEYILNYVEYCAPLLKEVT